MKTKQLIITILMITFVTMITTKVEATENDEQVEQTQNIENIEKDKQYNLTKEVKVKTLPLIFAIEKETIPSGNIRVTDILNDWCKIENEGKSGWIRINTIKTSVKQDNNQEEAKKEENLNTEGNNNQEQTNSSNEEESNQNQQENKTEEVTEISKTGYVKADGLNIRKEPTTSSEAIHSLSFNSKVKITGEIDGWYRIDYNDQIGYVSQKYVSDTKLPETTARGGYDRTTASSEENTVANQEAVEENQVETEEEQEEESTASASSEGNDVVELAKKYLGYKYVAGGSSPSTGFDCSGFTTYVFRNFGVSLNRSSKDQIKNGTAVSKSNLQPGDIVIFKNQGKTAIGHVGILFGNLIGILYSLGGGILSFLVMALLKKGNHLGCISVSVAGGIAHNIGQILIAALVVSSHYVLYYFPVLLIAGLLTGFLIGLLAQELIVRLRFLTEKYHE